MTRTAARTTAARRTGTDLEAWLLGDPELDPAAVTLLAAYRDAAEAAKPAADAPAAGGEIAGQADEARPGVRAAPGVARLRTVEGVEDSRLAALHGQLLAAGFLTTELLGRADGLCYRVTREGLRRLVGEAEEAEAA